MRITNPMMPKVTLIVVSIAVSLGSLSFAASSSKDPLVAIRNGIISDICREVFWYESPYPLGKSLPLQVKIYNGHFVAFVKRLSSFQGEPVSYYYKGLLESSKAIVTNVQAPNDRLNLSPPDFWVNVPAPPKTVFTDTVLTLPSTCPSSLEPSNPTKQKMVETVFKTVYWLLKRDKISGSPWTIFVADFNVDYPGTYVLIEGNQSRNLIYVNLHDPKDWESKEYLSGPYLYVERRIYPNYKDWFSKIRKHAIIRKINLNQIGKVFEEK
jgi:hypothetical protein